jgi:capsular exopolysaccharide synthesis family protein
MIHQLGISPYFATTHASLLKDLLQDKAELANLRQVLGDNNPEIKELVYRIRETEAHLADYQNSVGQRLDSLQSGELGAMLVSFLRQRLSNALQYESRLTLDYDEAMRQASQLVGKLEYLDDLERTEIRLDDQITKLVERITEVGFLAQRGNIQTAVTDDPKVIEAQVWPRLFLVGPFSLIVGLAFGVAAVSVLDVLDDRFRSPEELRLQLAVPLLAMIKKLAAQAESGLDAIQMHVAPDAVESEAFRTLRTAIAFSRPETGRIVVSSTEPGDGKTTVLANLAVAYARAGKRTLMIDADMRRPGLTRLLELRSEDGLTQVLQGTGIVAEMARKYTRNCGIEGLDVLPSGPRQINPAELLAGPRLAELLAWAESSYDQILIDAPPAGAAADASMIAANTDGLVLVVRPDKNRRQSVVRAVEGFRAMGIEPLGIVVNGLIADGDKGYYAYAEGYHYGYGEEVNNEWSEPDQVPRRVQHAEAPHMAGIDARPSTDESADATEAAAPIVPRRAA